jgi:DNA-binding MarR family transcriptional regulator
LDSGYVEQCLDPNDSRNRPVRLTRRGRAAVKASVRIQADMRRRWEQHASPEDVTALVRTLELVVRAENGGQLPPVRPVW